MSINQRKDKSAHFWWSDLNVTEFPFSWLIIYLELEKCVFQARICWEVTRWVKFMPFAFLTYNVARNDAVRVGKCVWFLIYVGSAGNGLSIITDLVYLELWLLHPVPITRLSIHEPLALRVLELIQNLACDQPLDEHYTRFSMNFTFFVISFATAIKRLSQK